MDLAERRANKLSQILVWGNSNQTPKYNLIILAVLGHYFSVVYDSKLM